MGHIDGRKPIMAYVTIEQHGQVKDEVIRLMNTSGDINYSMSKFIGDLIQSYFTVRKRQAVTEPVLAGTSNGTND